MSMSRFASSFLFLLVGAFLFALSPTSCSLVSAHRRVLLGDEVERAKVEQADEKDQVDNSTAASPRIIDNDAFAKGPCEQINVTGIFQYMTWPGSTSFENLASTEPSYIGTIEIGPSPGVKNVPLRTEFYTVEFGVPTGGTAQDDGHPVTRGLLIYDTLDHILAGSFSVHGGETDEEAGAVGYKLELLSNDCSWEAHGVYQGSGIWKHGQEDAMHQGITIIKQIQQESKE